MMAITVVPRQTFTDVYGGSHEVDNAHIVECQTTEAGEVFVILDYTSSSNTNPTSGGPNEIQVGGSLGTPLSTIKSAWEDYKTAMATLQQQESAAALAEANPFNPAPVSQAMGASGTTELSALPQVGSTVTLTGALTGNAIAELPSVPPAGWWAWFINLTTGAHTLTIEATSGTGIVLAGNAADKVAMLYSDGTNILRGTPDTANTP